MSAAIHNAFTVLAAEREASNNLGSEAARLLSRQFVSSSMPAGHQPPIPDAP